MQMQEVGDVPVPEADVMRLVVDPLHPPPPAARYETCTPEAARRIMGKKSIIGFSTHTVGQAGRAQQMPVDYIGFGPVYPTRTKQDTSPVAGLRELRGACGASSKPVVAIGGIGLSTVRDVLEAGASSAAVISALMGAASIAGRMEEFLKRATGKP